MRKIFNLVYSKDQYYNTHISVYADYFEIQDGVFIFYKTSKDLTGEIVACYPIVNTAIILIQENKNKDT